ncbi:MAG: hypothetical protein KatS3mg110_2793 [Pirellulaceae bacterium]|nr:MAG: hypothetical protein KatS3mg110_2793 [Pirellulaceae bacterium]
MAIALSGCSALGAEVVWTRLLSLTLGGTVYTFSIILAVFLAGLGVGSAAAAAVTGRPAPRLHLAWVQVFLVAAIGWAHYQLTASIPYWPIEPTLTRSVWDKFQLDLLRSFWAIFPAACAWGASFPLALAVALRGGSPVTRTTKDPAAAAPIDSGRVVGVVYAMNTLGAISGSLVFSLGVIPLWGTQRAGQMLVAMALAAAMVVWGRRLVGGEPEGPERRPLTWLAETATAAVVAVLAVSLIVKLPHTPAELIAYGRFLPRDLGWGEVVYAAEGANASVAVTLLESGTRNFHVSGKIEASSEPQDMRLQRMLGHIPALVHPDPRTVLVVGCGAGVTAGTFLLYPHIERVVVCEIEPLVPKVVARYFAGENYHLIDDPRVHFVYDDARHYILTTQEKFDIITSDPIHPWVKGAASLYTQEYFQLCRPRLNPGGVMTQWVPLYESDLPAVKSELATFFSVFPEATIWSNDFLGAGYDVVLLGMRDPTTIDLNAIEQKLASPAYRPVADSLAEVGFGSGFELLATYAGEATHLTTWLAGVPLNRDLDLRLQYLAGLGATYHREEMIFREMLDQLDNHEPRVVVAAERRAEFIRRVRRESSASGDPGAAVP